MKKRIFLMWWKNHTSGWRSLKNGLLQDQIWDLTTSLHFWTTTLFLWWKSLNGMFSWLFKKIPFLLFHIKMKFHLSSRKKPALSSFKILVIICHCDHPGYHSSAQKPRLLEQCKIHINLHSPLFPKPSVTNDI